MENLSFTHAEALAISNSLSHLKDTTFVDPKSKLTYLIFTALPIPVDKNEQSELRDMLASFFEGGGRDKTELDLFESREREDVFTVALFGISPLKQGANFLTLLLGQFVNQGGLLQYGFRIHQQSILF